MPAAVEHRGRDASLRCALREQRTHLLRLGRLVPAGAADRRIQRRRGYQRAADRVVDELREHMPGRAGNHQPRPGRAPGDLLPYPEMAPCARRDARGRAAGDPAVRPGPGARHLLLPSLPDLAADLLALVPHALALVRVRLAELAYVGRDLADLLLVDSLDHEPGGRLDPQRDPLGRSHRDRVAEAERELQVLASRLHPVPDP